MYDFLALGGLMYTGPQTVCGLAMVALSAKKALDLFVRPHKPENHHRVLTLILQLGVFAFFLGILGQALSIMAALQAIKSAGNIELHILLSGIQEMMIAPVYGLSIFLVSLAAWSALRYRYEQLGTAAGPQANAAPHRPAGEGR